MRIFGPLPCSTISPVTVTLASASASVVTVSPSTRRMAGSVTVSPASPASRLTVNRSPTATLCWLPPAFTTAYTTDSSFVLLVSSLFPRARPVRRPGAGRAADAAPAAPEGPPPGACNPTSVPERRGPGRTAPGSGRRPGRPAGGSPATRPRAHDRLGDGADLAGVLRLGDRRGRDDDVGRRRLLPDRLVDR